jgi:hypothetical protein
MKNPFRKKPAPVDTLVLHDTPCPSCDLADFVKIAPIQGLEVVECVNCKTQWFFERLLKNGYTSGKG